MLDQPADQQQSNESSDTSFAEYVFPLESVVIQQNTNDLRALSDIIGDAKIIALGEATHGTKEFFQLKHRILSFLADSRREIIFAIEANMTEAQCLNAFILDGQGDPAVLLSGMLFWTWETQEVLDMILWMRDYNLSGQGIIRFFGFDMQFPNNAANSILSFLKIHDPTFEPITRQAYAELLSVFIERFRVESPSDEQYRHWSALRVETQRIVEIMESQREIYTKQCSCETVEWMIQQARVICQAAGLKLEAANYRDQCMAANVAWLQQRHPSATLVLWGHNIHIMRTPSRMGGVLAKHFADDYCPIGFTFYAGDYVAVRDRGEPIVNTAQPALDRSIEALFHTFGYSPLLFDLRMATTDPSIRWLATKRPTRNIGALAADGPEAYALASLPELYRAVIFVDQSTPSQILNNQDLIRQ